MDKTIGFIGIGNMGSAMIGGIITAGLLTPDRIIASARTVENLVLIKEKYGIDTTTDNRKVAEIADILILAIKPNAYPAVIDEIKGSLREGSIIVSIAAGLSLKTLQEYFAEDVKIVRVMPNTPALVGAGMSALCNNQFVSNEDIDDIKSILNSFGRCETVDEQLMDTVTGISGSSPAYVYLFIEAMADAAVQGGMPREQAYKFAAQAVLGAAKMVLETGIHPGILKDNVCSPGGTTIEAISELERRGFRSAVISAVEVCIEKSKKMGNR